MRFALPLTLIAAAFLVSCGGGEVRSASAPSADWKAMVTPADLDRIRDWRTAFVKALDIARARGSGAAIVREGALLNPDAALGGPLPGPGTYRCRTVKLGGQGNKVAAFNAFPEGKCSISKEGDVFGFARIGGVQRPVGLIFPGEGPRQIFLGTMMLGDEVRALDYGRDATRDMAGAVERIGPGRWRLILPYPRMESMLDVIEIMPAA